nr:T9SS type A sorting domain-containing protein [uncultured Draconibacterium sp.]
MIKIVNSLLFLILVTGGISVYGNSLMRFSYEERNEGDEIFADDDVSDTVICVKDFGFSWISSSKVFTLNLNDQLVLGFYNKGLWKSDGTEEGTFVLKDVNIWVLPENPEAVSNGVVLFGGWENLSSDNYLWKTDGTTEGTVLVKDIPTPYNLQFVWNKWIFKAPAEYYYSTGPFVGWQISSYGVFISDGTTDGTYQVDPDFSGGIESIFVFELVEKDVVFDGRMIYTCNELFENISLLKNFDVDEIINPTKVNDSLVFFGTEDAFYIENIRNQESALWKTDGTLGGTESLVDSFHNISNFTIANGKLFFIGDDVTHGGELWISDGTQEGTRLVKDISSGVLSSNLDNLLAYNGKLYFTVYDDSIGFSLWESNGTEDGTFLVKEIISDTFANSVNNMMVSHQRLFFTVANKYGSVDLWKSDGTAIGTSFFKQLAKLDILYTANDYYISNLIFIDDILYFLKNDYFYGKSLELWKYVLPSDFYTGAELIKREETTVYPNPTHDILYFISPEINKHVIIVDIYGKVLYENEIEDNLLDVSFLSPGIYIITINDASSRFIKN